MSATEPLCLLIGINPSVLQKEEIIILEAELFVCLCEELKEIFKAQYKHYFRLMKFTEEMEDAMLESNFISLIIKDILLTEEYTLQGIAHYTNTPEDVVHEIVSGRNASPSATFLRRAIELHRLVRRDLYGAIIKKITSKYLTAA